jgi:hypothetical protein
VKAHRSALGGKGGRGRRPLVYRGGQTTKIHFLTDVLGRPAINVSDIRIADELIEAARPARRLIALSPQGLPGGLPHDMLAINFLSAVVLAAIIAFRSGFLGLNESGP